MPNQNFESTSLADSDADEIEQLTQYSLTHIQALTAHVGVHPVYPTIYQINNVVIFNRNSQQNFDRALGTFGPVMCKLFCFALPESWKKLCRSASTCMLFSQASCKHRAHGCRSADVQDILANGREAHGWHELPKTNGASDLAINNNHIDSPMASGSGQWSVPRQYVVQEQDFFKIGRYFRIWAETPTATDGEIHMKEFILLDTSNSEGKGIRVDKIDKARLTAGASRYSVAVIGRGRPASDPNIGHARPTSEPSTDPRFTKIYLDEISGDGPTERYARLDHTYNIPFTKYPCQDLGMLEPDSLDQLRIRFIEYMAVDWRLVDQLKNIWDSRQAGRPRGAP